MNKLQEAVYFKRIDFSDLFYPQDRRLTGAVSKPIFSSGLKRARVTLNDLEISEILEKAPTDPQGNILYKDFQRSLARQELVRSIYKRELDSFAVEKVASAVSQYISDFPGISMKIEDLHAMLRMTWLDISPDELRQVWDLVPHDRNSLAAWAKQHALPVGSFQIPRIQESKPAYPQILAKLREIAVVYGNTLLIQSFNAKEVLFREDLLKLLERFRVVTSREEFDEFREWAINHEIMKRYGSELGFNSRAISQYFEGLEVVEQQFYERDVSVLQQVVSKTVRNFVRDKLYALKKCLQPFMSHNHIEEIRLREVLRSVIPTLTNENISLIINSLKFTIPANSAFPFRQINITEFIALFDNSEFSILPTAVEVPLPLAAALPASHSISESFLVKPRDYNWEKTLISRVCEVHQPLLANMRINDYNSSGGVSLEVFHYTLRKSLEWLTDEEVFFLTELGIRECGCIDVQRTEDIRRNINKHRESETISAAWYPDGEQYNISYIYFFVVLERLAR